MSKSQRKDTGKITEKPVATAKKPRAKKAAISRPKAVVETFTTPNASSETTMEVHHHPQLEHKPKPWKEYLIEGFMIFIAVMMGFIAENIRETITNNEHTRQLTLQTGTRYEG